ncbi:MAG: FAD:protein FMN transferase [Bacilli bacterium]|nr:FAD:protein FMN transferase [Bacilli bacterium]
MAQIIIKCKSVKNGDIVQDKKRKLNIVIRVVLLIIFLGVAVFFITKGIVDLFSKKPGWSNIELEKITTKDGEELYPYYGDIKINYYFDEDRQSMLTNNEVLEGIYNSSLGKTFMLLDTNNNYADVINLKYINEHPGEEIIVEPFLYDTLKELYQYSIDSSGVFNVFAGELYSYWQDQILSGDPTFTDPIYDEVNKLKVENIVSCSLSQLEKEDSLIFDDSKMSIIYNVSSECSNSISLNTQFFSSIYAINDLYDDLIEQNYIKGYIYTGEGNVKTLGNHPVSSTWDISLADPNNIKTGASNSFSNTYVLGNINVVTIGDYLSSGNYGIHKEDNDAIRYLYYDATTGYPINNFRAIQIITSSNSFQDTLYNALLMMNSPFDLTKQKISELSSSSTYILGVYNATLNVGYDDIKAIISKEVQEYIYFTDSEIDVEIID